MSRYRQRIMPPCKASGVPCSNRRPGCQDHCLRFSEYKERLEAAKQKDAEEKRVEPRQPKPELIKYYGKWRYRIV